MHILIEEHQYRQTDVADCLAGLDTLENIDHMVTINYVGYFYNQRLGDCVFILPKVLMDARDLVFGRLRPEDIICPDTTEALTHQERAFIYEFSVWIYRAIAVYNRQRQDNDIVLHRHIGRMGTGRRRLLGTLLDVLLSLVRWGRENRDFLMFTLKRQHSGYNKIDWTHTIAHSVAVVQHGRPVYLNPENKRRQVDFDEELLVIYYSILSHICDTYGFQADINEAFTLLRGRQFAHYLDGFGKTRLRQIKYKYFSDKAIELWELCYAFFDKAHEIRISTSQKEYLLAKNFNIVFEAIIDELIGDKNTPDGLKEQYDGKRVDHMYTWQGLIENEQKPVYYIGDSKYYKLGNPVGRESVYKQYTYARNVIQWNLDLFLDEDAEKPEVKLRDSETEGYNVIPNFFISAKMDEHLSYEDKIYQTETDTKAFVSRQFENRLFDRDTLLVFHYDVNFLYVVSLYARNNEGQKVEWRSRVRGIFRTEIQKLLRERYDFYAMRAHPDVDGGRYIREHFKDVLGKVYTPFADQNTYSLALDNSEKNRADNAALLATLRQSFYVEECQLGQNPSEVLPRTIGVASAQGGDKALLITKEGLHFDKAIQKLSETGLVGIALQMGGATLKLVEGFTSAKYLIIHNKGNRYKTFLLDGKGPLLVPAQQAEEMVVTKRNADLYLVYRVILDVDVRIGELDFSAVAKGGDSYSPQIMQVNQLKSHS